MYILQKPLKDVFVQINLYRCIESVKRYSFVRLDLSTNLSNKMILFNILTGGTKNMD
jgi:hypothetical protein